MLGSGGSERAGRAPGVLLPLPPGGERGAKPHLPGSLPSVEMGAPAAALSREGLWGFPTRQLPMAAPPAGPEHARLLARGVLGGFCSDLKMLGFGVFLQCSGTAALLGPCQSPADRAVQGSQEDEPTLSSKVY